MRDGGERESTRDRHVDSSKIEIVTKETKSRTYKKKKRRWDQQQLKERKQRQRTNKKQQFRFNAAWNSHPALWPFWRVSDVYQVNDGLYS